MKHAKRMNKNRNKEIKFFHTSPPETAVLPNSRGQSIMTNLLLPVFRDKLSTYTHFSNEILIVLTSPPVSIRTK